MMAYEKQFDFLRKKTMHKIITEDIDQILENNLPWEQFRNKTFVVITGSDLMYAYFVHVLMRLNEQGYNITVITIVNNSTATKRAYGDYIGKNNFHLLYYDNTCLFKTNGITDISSEIHCILFGDRWDTRTITKGMTQNFLNANVLNVFELLKLKPENFLFHSTIAIYGDVNNALIYEKDFFPFNHLQIPNGMYKSTRKLAESICCSMAMENNTRVLIIRAPSFYGPETDLQSHYPLNDFLFNVLNHQDIVINSDGSPRRDFSYFSDVIAGCFYILLYGKTCEAYNLTSTQDLSLKELADIIVSLYPKYKLKVMIKNSPNANEGRTGNNRFLIDINKAKALGWNPKVDIQTGIKKTIDYFASLDIFE